MSDDDELVADSDSDDDTDELIANSRKTTNAKPPVAMKKKKPTASAAAAKKSNQRKIPDADNDSDSDDDAGNDDEKGLFDSDSDDDDKPKKVMKKKVGNAASTAAKKPSAAAKPVLSKRQRLEALANKHRKDDSDDEPDNSKKTNQSERRRGSGGGDDNGDKKKSGADGKKKRESGYDSADSYDSGDFQRTADDDDFIDTTGEDADAVNELYAEQNFDDERPDGMVSKKKKKQIKMGGSNSYEMDEDNPDYVGNINNEVEPDNPIMAAVYRMKKKKKVKRGIVELEEEVKQFLNRMEMAAEEDEQLLAEKKNIPATKKLSLLNEVCETLTKRDMQRMLLDFDLLTVCKRWVQPLSNGTLGNVTVRHRLMECISHMTGDTGIQASDLKRSEFGKVVMILFKHKNETPSMKRLLKNLIEQWSRPIFQKSGNMRDLERVHRSRGETGLAALSKQQALMEQQRNNNNNQMTNTSSTGTSNSIGGGGATRKRTPDELQSLISGTTNTSGKKLEAGVNRVRVPYSKGFAFQIRPGDRMESQQTSSQQQQQQASKRGNENTNKETRGGGGPSAVADTRSNLAKRMTMKSKLAGKNQRSANISVEGRATKG